MAAWIAAVIIPVVFFVVLIYLCCTCYIVRESEAIIIERFGRFHRILKVSCVIY
jgi:regulator of protease activity HflC (stomatin/prohibitin superfamily)